MNLNYKLVLPAVTLMAGIAVGNLMKDTRENAESILSEGETIDFTANKKEVTDMIYYGSLLKEMNGGFGFETIKVEGNTMYVFTYITDKNIKKKHNLGFDSLDVLYAYVKKVCEEEEKK
ncbi:MAG: hypothetical protein PHS92_01525 [Candidatus Gracilibacteria bacterium]|nr:hypothetical protein [Candidatus Gracilibacteria bacterium]